MGESVPARDLQVVCIDVNGVSKGELHCFKTEVFTAFAEGNNGARIIAAHCQDLKDKFCGMLTEKREKATKLLYTCAGVDQPLPSGEMFDRLISRALLTGQNTEPSFHEFSAVGGTARLSLMAMLGKPQRASRAGKKGNGQEQGAPTSSNSKARSQTSK